MKKFLCALSLTGIFLSACGTSNHEESDSNDSIEAARSADSMLQNQLNTDTSMNTDSTTDNMPTDSMQDNGQKR